MLEIKVSIELFALCHKKYQNGERERVRRNRLYQFMQHKKALLAFFVRQKETKMEEKCFYDNWYGGNWVFPNGSTEQLLWTSRVINWSTRLLDNERNLIKFFSFSPLSFPLTSSLLWEETKALMGAKMDGRLFVLAYVHEFNIIHNLCDALKHFK